jgi:CUB domain
MVYRSFCSCFFAAFQRVQVDFTVFATQANNDWVVLYDGNSQSAQLIARLSGVYQPAPTGLQSTQRFLFIRFDSDAVTNARGFTATYTLL